MKNILIGISGSIAAYKTILLIRELSKNDYACKVIITNGGLKFVTPELVAGLGIEVYTDQSINLADFNQAMLHINLAKWADFIMLVPASASQIARLARGIADNLLGQVMLVANDKPKCIVPAMNYQMYQNQITQTNLQKLKNCGFIICKPHNGIQACGDTGLGRMPEANELYEIIKNHSELSQLNNYFLGKTILITLGATLEPIDPVRFISNHSSGKMGIALINAALISGAKIIAVYAKLQVQLPKHDNLIAIEALSAEKMLKETLTYAPNSDIVIACAAVCDYKVSTPSIQKLKKSAKDHSITLQLIQNPDIIATLKQEYPHLTCVGFAAETENLQEYAIRKLQQKNLDLVIANLVGNQLAFNQDESQITILDKNGNKTSFAKSSKEYLAREIIEYIKTYKCQQ